MTPLEWIGAFVVAIAGWITSHYKNSTGPFAPTPDPIEPPEPPITPTPPMPPPPTPSKYPSLIIKWAQAIAIGEGAAPASHNPGNLKLTNLTASWGATKGRPATDGGFLCQFPNDQMGEDALCNFLMLGAANDLIAFHAPAARTLAGFTKIYAGNPPQGYIDAIVKYMGVSPDAQISDFLV